MFRKHRGAAPCSGCRMTAPAAFREFGRAPTRRNTQKLANLPLQEQCCDVLNTDLQLLTRAEARKAAEGRTRSCEAAGAAGQSRSLVTNPSCSPPVLAGGKQTGTAACSGVPSWEQYCCFGYPACRSISCQLSQLKKNTTLFSSCWKPPAEHQGFPAASQVAL